MNTRGVLTLYAFWTTNKLWLRVEFRVSSKAQWRTSNHLWWGDSKAVSVACTFRGWRLHTGVLSRLQKAGSVSHNSNRIPVLYSLISIKRICFSYLSHFHSLYMNKTVKNSKPRSNITDFQTRWYLLPSANFINLTCSCLRFWTSPILFAVDVTCALTALQWVMDFPQGWVMQIKYQYSK